MENILGRVPPFTPPCGGSECPHLNFFFKSKKYRLKYPCMPIFKFLSHKVWLCTPPPSQSGPSQIAPFVRLGMFFFQIFYLSFLKQKSNFVKMFAKGQFAMGQIEMGGGCRATPYDLETWKLACMGILAYIFWIFKKNWGGGTLTPPHGGVNGGTHPKIFSIFLWSCDISNER